MNRPGPRHGRRRGPEADPGEGAPKSGDQVQADRPAPAPRHADDQELAELPPDSPEAMAGGMSRAWQVALLVWAGLFGFLLLYELIGFAVKALR